MREIGVPRYPKVEHSYEIFCKLKWHRAKKQLPFIYMEKYLSIRRLKKEPLLGFSDTLGHLLMGAQNKDKAQMFTALAAGC